MKTAPFHWLRCHTCGWEGPAKVALGHCPGCNRPASSCIHFHSDRDGELPDRPELRQAREAHYRALQPMSQEGIIQQAEAFLAKARANQVHTFCLIYSADGKAFEGSTCQCTETAHVAQLIGHLIEASYLMAQRAGIHISHVNIEVPEKGATH